MFVLLLLLFFYLVSDIIWTIRCHIHLLRRSLICPVQMRTNVHSSVLLLLLHCFSSNVYIRNQSLFLNNSVAVAEQHYALHFTSTHSNHPCYQQPQQAALFCSVSVYFSLEEGGIFGPDCFFT